MGILADGVAVVHAATGDAKLRHWLVEYADALVAGGDRWQDARYALPVGYLAAVTGNARYERAARLAVRNLKVGDWGKTLAATGRVGFRLLAPLARDADTSGDERPKRAR
jgi:rhamnogalacturonyl hydrolase YesR